MLRSRLLARLNPSSDSLIPTAVMPQPHVFAYDTGARFLSELISFSSDSNWSEETIRTFAKRDAFVPANVPFSGCDFEKVLQPLPDPV